MNCVSSHLKKTHVLEWKKYSFHSFITTVAFWWTCVLVEHCTAFQILELAWTLPLSFFCSTYISTGYLLFYHSNFEKTPKSQLQKDRTSWRRMWYDLMLKSNYLKWIVHAVSDSYWISQNFIWVFKNTLPHSCASAVEPQDASVHDLGT